MIWIPAFCTNYDDYNFLAYTLIRNYKIKKNYIVVECRVEKEIKPDKYG